MSLKITVLGCGNSSGVPAIGNFWGSCDPNEPKNKRMRCCLAVQSTKKNIVIDTGADLRHQVNSTDISTIDAVFFSHYHSDHTAGIDDLRGVFFRNDRQRIDCFSEPETMLDLQRRFSYLFENKENHELYPAILKSHVFSDSDFCTQKNYSDINYIPFLMDHGTCQAVGYRFGDLSYCVDMKSLDDKALDVIKGSKVWLVDGAGHNNSNNMAHADLETIFEYNKFVKAERVYITSLSSYMDYQTLKTDLPSGFYPAYDGLTFNA